MNIELTREQYAQLLVMLDDLSTRYYSDAAAFARLGKTGYAPAVEQLKQGGEAFKLLLYLHQYGEG